MIPAPKSIAYDYARDYNFVFTLAPNPLRTAQIARAMKEKSATKKEKKSGKDYSFKLKVYLKLIELSGKFLDFLIQFQLDYVSQLAESVSIPDQKLNINEIDLGFIKYPVPSGVELSSIKVTYLDDIRNTVETFHRGWQNTAISGLSPTTFFNSLPILCLSCLFSPTIRATPSLAANILSTKTNAPNSSIPENIFSQILESIPFDLPMYNNFYPLIFPVNISCSEYNKGGRGLKRVTVEYIRIPYLTSLDKTATDTYSSLISASESTIKQTAAKRMLF